MSETYIEILLQSLKKKEQVLYEIIRLDEIQKEQLEDEMCQVDDFDETVEAKSQCVEQLEQLDSGFQKIYDRVSEELKGNKETYADEIRQMQELIKHLTDLSVEIQAQEARNKDLMTRKFADVKKKTKGFRTSGKVADQYYKNMMKLNNVEPQFMDNKNQCGLKVSPSQMRRGF